ncbi:MAG: hypothetical protein A2283_07740 [Lentisphaerae bacterium RIFOXYA12_FULL_48_11]|nr:MAG: hypothetical protein A2283_07740 [Lentisphaerae bacterium RIFOXYA12_FULL_48_11]
MLIQPRSRRLVAAASNVKSFPEETKCTTWFHRAEAARKKKPFDRCYRLSCKHLARSGDEVDYEANRSMLAQYQKGKAASSRRIPKLPLSQDRRPNYILINDDCARL